MSAFDSFPLPPVPSTPPTSMPQHAIDNLRGHASGSGDSSVWPLDETRLAEVQKAMKIRRPVVWAAWICRVMYVLILLNCLKNFALWIGGSSGDSNAHFRVGPSPFEIAMLDLVLVAFFYILEWQMRRSQRWAAMLLGMLLLLMFIVMLDAVDTVQRLYLGGAHGNVAALIVFAILAVPIGLIYVAITAFMAIPEFLRQPTWCRELIAKTRM